MFSRLNILRVMLDSAAFISQYRDGLSVVLTNTVRYNSRTETVVTPGIPDKGESISTKKVHGKYRQVG